MSKNTPFFIIAIGFIFIVISPFFFSCAALPDGNRDFVKRTPGDCYQYNGHTYIVVTRKLTWHASRDICFAVGGHLVVLNDWHENSVMKARCTTDTWIGLTDEITEGKYIWEDNSPFDFKSWANQPVQQPNDRSDNQGISQDYVAYWQNHGYGWNDIEGGSCAFICEFDFIITDDRLLKGIRDYLYGLSSEKLVARESENSALVRQISDIIVKQKIPGVSLQEVPGGIKLAMNNIVFSPDSAELETGEKVKLDTVGALLKQLSDRKFMVVGHTAQFGSYESCMELSSLRAKAVADYLENRGFLQKANTQIQGKGYREPVAENDTEAEISKNRRVEIIIRTAD